VDTHINAILFHASGISSTITVSFEIWNASAPLIEVFGTKGTLSVPDQNEFSESVRLRLQGETEWTVLEPSAGYIGAGRGYGLAEMAEAIAHNRTPRSSGDLGFHVLEIMGSILTAAST
jgi:predicted dehydrogenase